MGAKDVKQSWLVLLMLAFVTMPAAAQDAVAKSGKMVTGADGARLGAVYRVTSDGSAQVIFEGKMVTIPAATLSVVDGKLTTSLSTDEVRGLH